MRLHLLLLFFNLISCERECPDPEKEFCYIANKYDKFGNPVKCTKFGCPPCWKKGAAGWKCYNRKDINCDKDDIVDLNDYDKSCERYKKGYSSQSNLVDPPWNDLRS